MNALDYLWFIGIPVVFILIVLYVMRPKAKARHRQHGEIPFAERKKTEKRQRS